MKTFDSRAAAAAAAALAVLALLFVAALLLAGCGEVSSSENLVSRGAGDAGDVDAAAADAAIETKPAVDVQQQAEVSRIDTAQPDAAAAADVVAPSPRCGYDDLRTTSCSSPASCGTCQLAHDPISIEACWTSAGFHCVHDCARCP